MQIFHIYDLPHSDTVPVKGTINDNYIIIIQCQISLLFFSFFLSFVHDAFNKRSAPRGAGHLAAAKIANRLIRHSSKSLLLYIYELFCQNIMNIVWRQILCI